MGTEFESIGDCMSTMLHYGRVLKLSLKRSVFGKDNSQKLSKIDEMVYNEDMVYINQGSKMVLGIALVSVGI